jgi:Glutathione S-transferase, N-terminal domain
MLCSSLQVVGFRTDSGASKKCFTHQAMKLSRTDKLASQLATRLRGRVGVSAAARARPPPDHHLVLYEYEASPWCRLVREYATILDLNIHIRPCPRQTLFLEGAFDASSRFRPEAMDLLKSHRQTDDLTFPLLVDDTYGYPIVLAQSYEILEHLWEHYGQDILAGENYERRPDQRWNSTNIPFPLRFLSLVAPSYLRPWPTSGVLQTASEFDEKSGKELTSYQAEGCPESRLTREVLCTLEIPYLSVAVGKGSLNTLPDGMDGTPVLVDEYVTLQGADKCTQHLWDTYRNPNSKLPKLWSKRLTQNLGREGSFGIGAYTAFLKGSRAFVPPRALK